MPTLFTVAGFPFVTMLIERYPSTGPGDTLSYCTVLDYFVTDRTVSRGYRSPAPSLYSNRRPSRVATQPEATPH